jgi:hypothetical protein
MEIDYDMVGEGFLLSNQYILMELDGTFHTVTDHSLTGIHKGNQSMPGYKASNGPVQLLISEYTANTLLRTV